MFDSIFVATIIAAQDGEYNNVQALRENLGRDQVVWLDSASLKQAITLYSPRNMAVNQPRGGAVLSLELAHYMNRTESNRAGKAWLAKVDLWDDNVLSKTLSFNSMPYRQQMRGLMQEPPPTQALPNVESATSLTDVITNKSKSSAARVSLGDKALGFMETFLSISESVVLRKFVWLLHITSLMGVKIVKTVQGLPVPQIEAKLTRCFVSLGPTTFG